MRRRREFQGWKILLFPALVLCGVLALFTAIGNLRDGQSAEAQKQLENNLRRAAVTCYTTEGVYPSTLEELQRRYGIQVDSKRFAVFYEIFADNQMPEITVVPLQ
ncbi:hypothetical protein [Clostridium sp. D33t1_170424_F3]|uniref:hypothetical protein n=1 Tax=Clostridium sp. D33t1_170424_F3 TaxID=2787099 RepID=UPI0018AC4921|nr:hypothetical protein [Clostridium sp. D33t1_170424_F3]